MSNNMLTCAFVDWLAYLSIMRIFDETEFQKLISVEILGKQKSPSVFDKRLRKIEDVWLLGIIVSALNCKTRQNPPPPSPAPTHSPPLGYDKNWDLSWITCLALYVYQIWWL